MTKRETVFSVGAEGGSLTISRGTNANGEVEFYYHHSEMDLTDEGLGVNKRGVYKDFETPFQLIHQRFEWFKLHVIAINGDYMDYVIIELLKMLNKKQVEYRDWSEGSKMELEMLLSGKFRIEKVNVKGLRSITVQNIQSYEVTEYEAKSDSGNSSTMETKYLPHYKFKALVTNDETIHYESVLSSNSLLKKNYIENYIGNIEVQGSSIILKNAAGEIDYVFSSNNYTVLASSIDDTKLKWVFKDNREL